MNRCPSCSAAVAAASGACPSCGANLESLNSPTVSMPAKAVPSPNENRPHAGSDGNHSSQTRFIPGTLLGGRYRIVGLLGRGGMGEVYRADDTKLGQAVALKFLPEALARDADRLVHFYSEARIGRQVSHPNVCRLYDLVELDGQHCLTMEYVDGEDLASLLTRIGRLQADKAVDIARDLCAGLAAAHEKGFIHRDLKPANVMIDGKGRARITDFGLAALAEEARGEGLLGTPAYMAPEQFAGQPASIRSDIYALGLVLYETFTGKRRFEAKSLAELKAMHAESRPPSLSSSARDIPPAVEKMILRCLEKNPEARPASVLAVMAALPGGDPLQAALAAGETPSPAMVAAAGKTGDLRTGVAWALLLSAIAGMIGVAFLADHSTVIGKARPDKPPEVLTEKAKQLLAKFGYTDPPSDSVSAFEFDEQYLKYVHDHDPSPDRWKNLAAVRPGPLLFWHRESPRPMFALRTKIIPLAPAEVGRVTRDDPPMTVPGMVEITLDRRGWLTGLLAVPPQLEPPPSAAEPDWPGLLAAAGLEAGVLKPAAPRWTPPVASDRKAAWDGSYPGQPGIPFHIEAASFHGKPVWFEVQGEWLQRGPRVIPGSIKFVFFSLLGLILTALVTTAILVQRNLRLGRGDRVGSLRLAIVLFISSTISLLFRANHVASVHEEFVLCLTLLAQTTLCAVLMWAEYLAFEPFARRRWPALLISWSRLLAGRLRDPLVGRDILLGGVVGILLNGFIHLASLLPPLLGLPAGTPRTPAFTVLGDSRQLIYFIFGSPYTAVAMGLGTFFTLFLLRSMTRYRLVALVDLFIFTYFTVLVTTEIPQDGIWSIPAAIFTALWLTLLMRAGLLAAVAGFFFFSVLEATPLTLDFSAWYSGRMLLSLLVLAAILICAFHAALGGKPLFGQPLLEIEA